MLNRTTFKHNSSLVGWYCSQPVVNGENVKAQHNEQLSRATFHRECLRERWGKPGESCLSAGAPRSLLCFQPAKNGAAGLWTLLLHIVLISHCVHHSTTWWLAAVSAAHSGFHPGLPSNNRTTPALWVGLLLDSSYFLSNFSEGTLRCNFSRSEQMLWPFVLFLVFYCVQRVSLYKVVCLWHRT